LSGLWRKTKRSKNETWRKKNRVAERMTSTLSLSDSLQLSSAQASVETARCAAQGDEWRSAPSRWTVRRRYLSTRPRLAAFPSVAAWQHQVGESRGYRVERNAHTQKHQTRQFHRKSRLHATLCTHEHRETHIVGTTTTHNTNRYSYSSSKYFREYTGS
jgi:hypothetical protein